MRSSISAMTVTSWRFGLVTRSSIWRSSVPTRCVNGRSHSSKLRMPDIMSTASRSVREGRVQLEHLYGLDGRSCTPNVYDAGGHRGSDRRLCRVPAATKAGIVQSGRCYGSMRGCNRCRCPGGKESKCLTALELSLGKPRRQPELSQYGKWLWSRKWETRPEPFPLLDHQILSILTVTWFLHFDQNR